MKNLNEQLLEAWLRLSVIISNNKMVSDMPYNEALICNLLYENHLQNPEKNLTATDLCNRTKMLKSQMNRTLNSMEEKGLITRLPSDSDKRLMYIVFDAESEIYRNQHQKILELIDTMTKKTGAEKSRKILEALNTIADAAEEIIK